MRNQRRNCFYLLEKALGEKESSFHVQYRVDSDVVFLLLNALRIFCVDDVDF